MFFKNLKEKNIALIDTQGNSRTYGQLVERSYFFSDIIPQRSLMIILCDYSLETMEMYFFCLCHKVVPILLDKNAKKSYILDISKRLGVQYIWSKYEVSNDIFGSTIYHSNNYQISELQTSRVELDEQLAIILPTSGSTSSSKMVRISYKNIVAVADYTVRIQNMSEMDRGITTLPMQYSYGLAFIHMHWWIGASIILTDYSVINNEFWKAYDNYSPTNFAGVPFTYELLEQLDFLSHNINKLRFVSLGGGKMAWDLREKVIIGLGQKGVKCYLFYGLTETMGPITNVPDGSLCKNSDCIGNLIYDSKLRVADRTKELLIVDDSVCMGYAVDKEDLKIGDENHGMLYTGDIVNVDSDGNVYLIGRISRFAKILSTRIALDDIEKILIKRFPGMKCACVNDSDQCIVVYVEGEYDKSILVKTICDEIYLINENQIRVEICDLIPRCDNGKIDYKMLQV